MNSRRMHCGFRHEKQLHSLGVARIAGIDEAGRGALAGPVVAAAAILPERFRHRKLNDSKQLSPELREEIYQNLTTRSDIVWAVGIVDSVEIDRINILRAAPETSAQRLGKSSLKLYSRIVSRVVEWQLFVSPKFCGKTYEGERFIVG